MEFKDFDKSQQGHLNGDVGTFIDNKIRKEQIWCAEQIFEDYYDRMMERHKKGLYGSERNENGVMVFPIEDIEKWMETDDAKAIVMSRIEKKLKETVAKRIARSKSPLTKRVSFGHKWVGNEYFDVTFGVQERVTDQISQEELSSLPYKPWTIEHVETILKSKYGKSLPDTLQLLSKSPI